MFRPVLLFLPFLVIGCTNTSQIQYHKQPAPVSCYSSITQKKLVVQAVGKDSAVLRIENKGAKGYDQVSLSKSELKEIMNLLGVFDSWSSTVTAAGVDITQTKYRKTEGDSTLSIDFSSRRNASVISLAVRITRQDSSYIYATTNPSCFYSSCESALDHLNKMDELSAKLP